MEITFLGTGTSCGVPVIGCQCAVCTSSDPRDRRMRCSVLVETGQTRLLVDCGPDFRMQMLPQPFRRIDGILVTHSHYDHVGGMDDIRPYCRFGEIHVYADALSCSAMLSMMPYCFADNRYPGVPAIQLHQVEPASPFTIGDIDILPIRVMHGQLPILGYRFGKMAYITDMKSIEDDQASLLTGVDVLVVNALRFENPHHSHQLVSDAVALAERVGSRRTYLIHMSHDVGLHCEASQSLPPGVFLAYDGLKIRDDE